MQQPVAARLPVGYDRAFPDGYRPNKTFYLSHQDRDRLAAVGKPKIKPAAAGTYAKQVWGGLSRNACSASRARSSIFSGSNVFIKR